MRWLALAFIALIAALQYPMWLGKGGWLQVREFDRGLAAQKEANAKLKLRNDALDADVRDLKTGFEAIEERARSELGMVKQDEVFFQLQRDAEPIREAPAPIPPPEGPAPRPIGSAARPDGIR
ncbi:MAG: cell division protein FtsB [Betaproteobacteria bacterium]|nr:cell division protein FtsB [Betaproteobacteria bacterium]